MRKRATALQQIAAVLLTGLVAGALGACAKGTSTQDAGTPATEAATPATETAAQPLDIDKLISQRFEISTSNPDADGASLTFYSKDSETNPEFANIPNTDELTPTDNAPSNPQRKDWTVMVYIIGTNLESEYYAASMDISEMYAAEVDFEQANVIYMTGGSSEWSLDIPNDRNVVWSLETLDYVAGSKSKSMGDPSTLASFVNFADTYYPAEHTMLVMWDHGGGPVLGYGTDELAGGDGLLLPEMAKAMESTQYHGGKKLDIVGFDACLMGSIEVADVWSDYADMMIASEEVEEGRGWNWTFLSVLNDEPDAQTVCESAIDSFKRYYQGGISILAQTSYTLAAYDLSVTPEVTSAVDELSVALQYDLDARDYSQINDARNKTTEFGVVTDGYTTMHYDLIDLRDFTNQFGEDQPVETGRINEALDRFVTYNASNITGANGVTVYLPATNQMLWDQYQQVMGEAMGDDFRNLSTAYARRWTEGLSISWSLSKLDLSRAPGEAALSEDGTEYLVPLEDEQVESLDQATYAVLAFDDGAYRPLLTDVAVTPDDEGVLHVPVDPKVLALTSDAAEKPIPLYAQQTAHSGDTARYLCPRITLEGRKAFKSEDNASAKVEADATAVDNVSFVISVGADGTPILTGVPYVQTDVVASRASADLSNYQALSSILGYRLEPTQGEEGELLPHSQWAEDASSELLSNRVAIDDSLALELVPASELGFEISCQVVFTDQNGGIHATDLFELNA